MIDPELDSDPEPEIIDDESLLLEMSSYRSALAVSLGLAEAGGGVGFRCSFHCNDVDVADIGGCCEPETKNAVDSVPYGSRFQLALSS